MEKIGGVTPIKNEADNGLKNLQGSIAMARTGEPHSATDQFFINTHCGHKILPFPKRFPQYGFSFKCFLNFIFNTIKIEDRAFTWIMFNSIF